MVAADGERIIARDCPNGPWFMFTTIIDDEEESEDDEVEEGDDEVKEHEDDSDEAIPFWLPPLFTV